MQDQGYFTHNAVFKARNNSEITWPDDSQYSTYNTLFLNVVIVHKGSIIKTAGP